MHFKKYKESEGEIFRFFFDSNNVKQIVYRL